MNYWLCKLDSRHQKIEFTFAVFWSTYRAWRHTDVCNDPTRRSGLTGVKKRVSVKRTIGVAPLNIDLRNIVELQFCELNMNKHAV